MKIVKAERTEMQQWSSYWEQQDSSFIRPMSAEYFEKKYFETEAMEAYSIQADGTAIGYFGVKREVREGMKSVSFCDFILNPDLQGKGYFSQVVKEIREELFVDQDVLIFYPIHRNAMISWKFALRPPIIEKLNRWILELNGKEYQETKIQFQKVKESGSALQKISAYENGKWIADIWIYEITWNEKKGIELFTVEGQKIQGIFQVFFQYAAKEKYTFCIVKLSENCDLDTWLSTQELYRTEKNVLYKFLICDSSKVSEIQQWNPVTIGEMLDIPRDDHIIQKLFLKK